MKLHLNLRVHSGRCLSVSRAVWQKSEPCPLRSVSLSLSCWPLSFIKNLLHLQFKVAFLTAAHLHSSYTCWSSCTLQPFLLHPSHYFHGSLLSLLMTKNEKNAHHIFPELRVASSDCFLLSKQRPKSPKLFIYVLKKPTKSSHLGSWNQQMRQLIDFLCRSVKSSFVQDGVSLISLTTYPSITYRIRKVLSTKDKLFIAMKTFVHSCRCEMLLCWMLA